jgi:hypothetical protein
LRQGEIISFSVSGFLVKRKMTLLGRAVGGWPATFWVFAALALGWYPCWLYFAYEKPEDNPKIGEEELAYIRAGQLL